MDNKYLTPALRIHALEARHAAQVRRLRDERGAGVEPWVVLGSVPDDSPIAGVYAGDDSFPPEENTTQAGTDLTTVGDFSAEEASASYDEPLTMAYVVNAIADPFIKGDQGRPNDVTLDFGANTDTTVLNYAYALEQLEAAFYAQAAMNAENYSSGVADVISDLAAHEDIHRQTLATALGDNAIIDLTPDFSSIDFSSESEVLATAQVLEDTGVSAYNGAADLFSNVDFLVAAGSIVSVEARHASAIQDLQDRDDNFFGGDLPTDDRNYVIDSNGRDVVEEPDTVINDLAGQFIANDITVKGL